MSAGKKFDLDSLLTMHGLDALQVHAQVVRDGGDLTDETARLRAAVLLVTTEMAFRTRATVELIQEHDALRNRHAHTQGEMEKAHRIVAKAAVQHRDERLAVLARDTLHGFYTRTQALEAMPTGTQVYRKGLALAVGALAEMPADTEVPA